MIIRQMRKFDGSLFLTKIDCDGQHNRASLEKQWVKALTSLATEVVDAYQRNDNGVIVPAELSF